MHEGNNSKSIYLDDIAESVPLNFLTALSRGPSCAKIPELRFRAFTRDRLQMEIRRQEKYVTFLLLFFSTIVNYVDFGCSFFSFPFARQLICREGG